MKLAAQLDSFDQASLASGLVIPPDLVDEKTGEVLRRESLTQQEFAEEVDINTIVKRFGLTGELPETLRVPVSGDFTNATDYHTALNLIIEADNAFLELPPKLRDRFNQDPAQLMAFLEDPGNLKEAQELGLVNKAPERVRTAIEAVDDLTKVLTTPKA